MQLPSWSLYKILIIFLGTGRAEPIPLTVKAGLSTFVYFFALDWTWMAWLHETSESNPHQRNKKWSVIPSFIDRGGLGRDMLLKRQREVKEALKHETAKKRVKIEEKQRDNFRKHMSGRFAERQTSSDLYKSQKACEQLDKSKVRSCKDVRSSLIYNTGLKHGLIRYREAQHIKSVLKEYLQLVIAQLLWWRANAWNVSL